MELLDLLLYKRKLHNTCFLCFKETESPVHTDELFELHDESSITVVTLYSITNNLFPYHDIFLNQACEKCTDLIILMHQLLKKAAQKIQALHKHIDRFDENIVKKEKIDASHSEKQHMIFGKSNENIITTGKESSVNNVPIEDPNIDNPVCIFQDKAQVCDICGKTFKNTSSLKTHLKTHEEAECPYCYKKLKNNAHFKIHIRNHTKYTRRKTNFPYKCHDCGYESRSKMDLTTHMYKKHLKIRPFRCEICQKGFYSRSNLKEHILIHIKQKSFICEVCGDNFSCGKSLTNHLKLHSGDRPYKCDICNRGFISKCRRNEHLKGRHGFKQYSCDKCDKKYSLRKELNKHSKLIHGRTTQGLT